MNNVKHKMFSRDSTIHKIRIVKKATLFVVVVMLSANILIMAHFVTYLASFPTLCVCVVPYSK